jgi:hypothetical protein
MRPTTTETRRTRLSDALKGATEGVRGSTGLRSAAASAAGREMATFWQPRAARSERPATVIDLAAFRASRSSSPSP